MMLPDDKTAIIRIDKTISIDDESLFNCIDDNDNWVGSGVFVKPIIVQRL